MTSNDTFQEETDELLLDLTLRCARPTWPFRLLFNTRERQLLGFAINTLMGQRQHNLLMRKLDERYGHPGTANDAQSVEYHPQVTVGMSENGIG
jgi:hypothetical protein